MITRAGGITTVIAVGALLCAGCASGQREADSRDTAASFVDAMGRGDTRTACALLSADTRDSLETSEQQPCQKALRSVDIAGDAITSATVWGDRAQARSHGGTLFLVELDTGWKVTAAGCTRSADGTYDCLLGA